MAQKQKELAGIGRKEIKELDEAAELYVEKRDARMKLTVEEVAAREALEKLMKEHKLKKYAYEGERMNEETGETETCERVVEVEKQTKLTVRVPKGKKSTAEVEDKDEEEPAEKE